MAIDDCWLRKMAAHCWKHAFKVWSALLVQSLRKLVKNCTATLGTRGSSDIISANDSSDPFFFFSAGFFGREGLTFWKMYRIRFARFSCQFAEAGRSVILMSARSTLM